MVSLHKCTTILSDRDKSKQHNQSKDEENVYKLEL